MNEYFSQLYKKHVNSLYRFGIGKGFSHDACLDIIHDIFCKLIEKNTVFETDNIKHYLFRCFINRHMDIQKSRKNVIQTDVNDLPFVLDVSLENSTEENMIEDEEKERLKQKVDFLLGLLSDRQRTAVYLRFMEEMEYDEIGNLLNMNAESVRKLVFRALEKLRKYKGPMPVFYLLSVIFFLQTL